jgi:hypothetical protein
MQNIESETTNDDISKVLVLSIKSHYRTSVPFIRQPVLVALINCFITQFPCIIKYKTL